MPKSSFIFKYKYLMMDKGVFFLSLELDDKKR